MDPPRFFVFFVFLVVGSIYLLVGNVFSLFFLIEFHRQARHVPLAIHAIARRSDDIYQIGDSIRKGP